MTTFTVQIEVSGSGPGIWHALDLPETTEANTPVEAARWAATNQTLTDAGYRVLVWAGTDTITDPIYISYI